jgi:hypothetical protein
MDMIDMLSRRMAEASGPAIEFRHQEACGR